MNSFKVISEYELMGKRIVVLSKKRTLEEYNTKHIVCNGKEYSYLLTHNDYQIIVDSDKTLLGEEIYFTE